MEENDIGEKLNTLREEEHLCDVTLIVENRRFPCHRVVLSSRCSYFYAMFGNFKEKNCDEVNLGGLSSNGFEDLLKYIYNNKVNINKDNFKNLIIASDMLGIETLQASCVQFIEDTDGPNMLSDIFDLFIFADFQNYAKLGETLKRFICEKFSDICDSDSMTNLNYEQLKSILESKDLTVDKEETVFNGVLKWIKFDKEERLKHMEELLSLIKVPSLMSPYMIGLLLNEPIIKNDQKHIEMVVKRSVSSVYKTYKKPKLEFLEPSFLLLCLKSYEDYMLHLEMLQGNDIVKTFDGLPSLEIFTIEDTFVRGVVLNKNMLFVLCAFTSDYDNEFHKIDLESNTSIMLTPPPVYTKEFSLQTDGSRIYLNNQMIYKDIEDCPDTRYHTRFFIYDLQLDIWIEIPDLKINNHQIMNSCFTVHKNELYSIGGRTDNENRDVLNNVFAFDIRGNSWRELPPMTKPRYRSGACFINGNLYVCGGKFPDAQNLKKVDSTMEVFDFSSHKWMLSNYLPLRRYRHSMFCTNNKLYVIGGCNGGRYYENSISEMDIANLRFDDPVVRRARTNVEIINSFNIDKKLWRTTNIDRDRIKDAILFDS